ncbi:flavodoxin domain-containing protein [Actinoplanes sp. NPDC049596]|uniref:flavodoxin domain-containing protein n=1 Tax=unclassified Actinoplanes TaxID=2626549 RepID=UPI0034361B98
MYANVLVVYATRNGSTREVAEAVATVARAGGALAETVPAHAVHEPLTGYDLVVLGAPLYSGRWHRDAHRFLKRHRDDLHTVPAAVFALGPRRDDEQAWRHSWDQLHRALARRPWLTPVATGLFGGADPAGRGGTTRRDLRDWAEIGAWARQLIACQERAPS